MSNVLISNLKELGRLGVGDQSTVVDPAALNSSLWGTLPTRAKILVVAALSTGYSLFVLVDALYRFQEFSPSGIHEAILYFPFEVAAVASAGLFSLSVLFMVGSKESRMAESASVRLGAAWILASIPLLVDYLIDPFEVKLPIIAVFVIIGTRYWGGARNSYLSLVLGPFMALIAALDGTFHLLGNLCSSTGFDTCAVKGVSDLYLTMTFLLLSYLTVAGRNQRPKLLPMVIFLLIFALALLALALLP